METLTKKPTILAQFDLHNESLNCSKDTLTKNKTIRKRLASFIESTFGKKDLRFNDIKRDFADQFHHFLIEEFDFSNNTAVTYVWMMGKIFRFASDNGINVPVDPSQFYSYSKEEKSVNYLNLEQLDAIHNLELAGETDLVRDLFLYSCYTGMSLEELKKVSFSDIIKVDGVYCFSIKRGESFETRTIPCLPELMAIDNKYNHLRPIEYSSKVFPGIGNISASKHLKKLEKEAGIPFGIKFETARYTYMTTVALKYKLPFFVIREVLGYNKIQKTKEYQKLSEFHLLHAFCKWRDN